MNNTQTLSSHSSTPEFKRNVRPNGSTFLQTEKQLILLNLVNKKREKKSRKGKSKD